MLTSPLKLMLGDQEASICQLEIDGVDESLIW
jgi:hypothetical protein